MAEQDITFGVGLDLSKASDKIKDFAKDVDSIFNGIAKKVSDALTPGNGQGYSGLRAGKPLGIAGVADSAERALDELWRKRSASLTDAYLAVAKAQGVNPQAVAKRLLGGVRALEKFNTLPTEAEALAQDMIAHRLNPKTGQGRYGVIQHNLNTFAGTLYGLSAAFPGLIPREALEDVEQERNANRRVGAYFRHWQTHVLNKDEQESSLQKTLNQNRLFRAIAKTGAFDLYVGEADKNFIPESETNEQITNWGESALSIRRRINKLSAGGLSKGQQSAELKALNNDVKNLIKVGKKLGGQVDYASKQIKYSTDVFTGDLRGGGGVSRAAWALIGGKMVKDIFGAAGGMLESYWGESISRNVYSSRQAYLSRVTQGGKIAGSVAGGVIGALIGSVIPGVGTMVGANVGGAAGGEIGTWFGKYGETKYKADLKSSSDMMGRIRNKALFGAGYNTYFAQALTEQGIANGESAMGGLADKAMSLRARTMLGQVGEQEMLYYSMMPNYYAALMSGVTGPELMRIYQQDLAGITDPSMRYLVGQAIGNTEAFAAVNNPYFGSFYSRAAGVTAGAERRVGGLESGYAFTRGDSALITIGKNAEEIVASAMRGDETIYNAKYGKYGSRTWQKAQDQMELLKGTTIVNVIQLPDGTEIQRDEKTVDEIYTTGLQSFYVGG